MGKSRPQRVLIVAEPGDSHALVVAARLQERHACESLLWDSSRFPATDRLTQYVDDKGRVHIFLESPAVGRVPLSDFGSIWWRRPQRPRMTPDVSEPHMRSYCQREAQSLLRGMLESLEVPVFNNPYREPTESISNSHVLSRQDCPCQRRS
jgi:hypothetical protein